MRSITSTILFEEALDLIPTGQTIVYNSVTRLLQPLVTIDPNVSDCGTKLGEKQLISLGLIGRVELATGLIINRARLNAASTSGLTSLFVRSMSSCISPNGICKKCWEATRQYDTVSLGSINKVTPEFIIQTETFEALTGQTVWPISYDATQYDIIYIYSSAGLMAPSSYTISGSTVTFLVAPPADTGAGAGSAVSTITVRYGVRTYVPFVHWLAATYSGSLLGMSKLPVQYLPIRQDLHEALLPTGEVDLLEARLLGSPLTPPSVATWLSKVEGTLEKAIFISLLNALYMVG
jgi:hypothetical protein